MYSNETSSIISLEMPRTLYITTLRRNVRLREMQGIIHIDNRTDYDSILILAQSMVFVKKKG